MDFSAATWWWVAAGVAVAAELGTGTFYLLMIALGLAAARDRRAPRRRPCRRRSSPRALVGGGATALVALAPRARSRDRRRRSRNRDVNLDIGERVHVAAWAADGTAQVQLPRLGLDRAAAPGAPARAGRARRRRRRGQLARAAPLASVRH